MGGRGHLGVEYRRADRHRAAAQTHVHRGRVLGSQPDRDRVGVASMCQGCALPPDGARLAATATASTMCGRSASGRSRLRATSARGGGWAAGSVRSSSAAAMSTRTRPDESGSPKPILRTASATAEAPSARRPPVAARSSACVRPRPVTPPRVPTGSRRIDDAQDVRDLRPGWSGRPGSRCRVRPADRGRSVGPGSRSNRSTSTRPRSLVAMRTGCRALARPLATSAFMSSESHSSTTMSSPSRNSPMVSGVRPDLSTRTSRYGSISAIRRAAAVALFTPMSNTVAGTRLRLESSRSSKSASRSSPHSPCMRAVYARSHGRR